MARSHDLCLHIIVFNFLVLIQFYYLYTHFVNMLMSFKFTNAGLLVCIYFPCFMNLNDNRIVKNKVSLTAYLIQYITLVL